MAFVGDLWLAILAVTFVLWILSFVFWVVAPHHFGDRKKAPDEDGLMEYIRNANIPPGNYMIPHCGSGKEQNDPAFVERYKNGPRGTLNVYALPNLGRNMGCTILYFLVTAFTIGYITHVACPPGDVATTFMKVFRIAGTIGVLVFATSGTLNRIWFTERMWTEWFDGTVYGLACGLIFASMWPGG